MANKVLNESCEFVIKQDDYPEKIDFEDVFGRIAPVHIEIGSGKGTFLVNEARAYPENDYLGIEWASRFYRYAGDRLERWSLPNTRIMRTDAAIYIEDHVDDECVDCYHVYFPDPWHKKRHNKRRFIRPENIEQFLRTLKPDGIINIATDHFGYYEWMIEAFSHFTDRLEEIEYIRPSGAEKGEMAGTNFERKYIKEGRKTYTLAFRKR